MQHAPEAIEVADRRHLLQYLVEAMEPVAPHHHCLRTAETESAPPIDRTASQQLSVAAEPVHATRQESSILAVNTKLRFEAITTLMIEGT